MRLPPGHYKSTSRKYYLTAVPQCIFPDANVGPAIAAAGSSFDFIGIQFYNNPSCSNGNLDNNYASNWVPLYASAPLHVLDPCPTHIMAPSACMQLPDVNHKLMW